MKKSQLYISTMDENAHLTAKKYGLGIEIAEYSTAWNLDRERKETDAAVLPKLSCSKRFILHGPYSELFPCAVDPLIRQVARYRFGQTLELAREMDIHKVVFHGGFHERLYFPCWYQEQSVGFWKEFQRDIPEDMTICLENVLETEPEMLADIVRQTDCPRIRMCLDVGHANAYSGQSPLRWLDSCRDVIDHLHIHNNDGTWDLHRPLNEGTIPMRELLEKAEKKCRNATVTLEINGAESSVQWLKNEHILEE